MNYSNSEHEEDYQEILDLRNQVKWYRMVSIILAIVITLLMIVS